MLRLARKHDMGRKTILGKNTLGGNELAERLSGFSLQSNTLEVNDMMLFFDGQYPHCANFIRTRIIGMHPLHHVYRALVECIDDKELVRSAMSPGTYPRIVIEDLRAQMKGRLTVPGGMYRGECRADKRNHVDLDMTMCRGVENDPSFTRDLEHTLLHETVHWGRFIARKPSRIDGKEAGSWFEHLAWGDEFQNHYEIPCGRRTK